MVDRLTTLDASFLYLDEPGTPLHVGGVLVLEAPAGGVEAIAAAVQARLPLVPRYRQRVLPVPGHLADPVWADDPEFDPEYHLRRSALPQPGGKNTTIAARPTTSSTTSGRSPILMKSLQRYPPSPWTIMFVW